ncbi:MAG: hypothetical protein R3319_01395 [Candidatus Bathyarchaeia archaeon]|nr:hypothetical protein [Candidatus Bathyarchaeia archaeon]
MFAFFHKVFDELSLKVGEGFIESRTGTSAKEIFLEIFRTSQVKFDEETVRNLVRSELKLNWK